MERHARVEEERTSALRSTSPLIVPVYYDFSSPICYMTHRVMERLAPALRDLGIELLWSPIDLCRLTAWNRGDPMHRQATSQVARLSEELDVLLEVPPIWMDSRPALAMALALGSHPDEAKWRDELWTTIYARGRSLDDPSTLTAVASLVGIEPGTVLPVSFEEINGRTDLARTRGIRGAPTFLLDDWPVGGIQDDATMRSLLSRFAGRRQSPS